MAVKVIKATSGDQEEMVQSRELRVCAYARVSTDSEDQESSYEAQVKHYTSYIKANPAWVFAGVFADEGISGTQAKTRPQFRAMIQACERQEIDMVITKSISRFARNTLDCLSYIRKLKALSIPIVFEKENINTMESSGEVLVTILASIAQQESASISQNVTMGIRYGFEEGHGRLNTSVFLGYTGNGIPGSLVIVPEEADVVRRIYRYYLDGWSPGMICKNLMENGISSPAGGQTWYASTVQSILSNEKYCGDLLMQKYYTEDFLTHKVVRNTGQRPQYFVEDNHDPIVPKAVFIQVQDELKRRASLKMDPGRLRFGRRMALSGRLICGKCGRTLKPCTKKDGSETEWRCIKRAMVTDGNNRGEKDSDCDCRVITEQEARQAVIRAFNRLPEYKGELEVIRDNLNGEIGKADGMIKGLLGQQKQLEQRLENGRQGDTGKTGDEADVLRKQIRDIRNQMDEEIIERAGYANQMMHIRNLVELVVQMGETVQNGRYSSPEKMDTEMPVYTPACRDAEDFFLRTRYWVPNGVLGENGQMIRFDNDLIIRYLERVVIEEEEYQVQFKAGIEVREKA